MARVRSVPVFFTLGVVVALLLYPGDCFEDSTWKAPSEGEFKGRSYVVKADVTSGPVAGPAAAPATSLQSICFLEQPSPVLEQFVDPLPILSIVDVSDGQQHMIGVFKIWQKLHRDLPATMLYAYGTGEQNASMPGPLLLARRNIPSYIRWENHITDDKHFLTVDQTVARANPPRGGVPIVIHLHGMESQSPYDGHPEAWFTQFGDTGPNYTTQDYGYPNSIYPAMIWYHDHVVGMTRLNVAAGMAGPYIVRGAEGEEPAGLPSGDREIVLVFQDRVLFANGSINYPSIGDDTAVHPNWCPGYYGDTILVNGKAWPYLDVLPLRYRLRILNGASERYYSLFFDNPNVTFIKIGTDGGYLPSPVTTANITLAPSERVDCIVDFGGLAAGTRVVLNNSAPSPFPGGPGFAPFDPNSSVSAVLQFRVGATAFADSSTVPATLGAPLPNLLADADQVQVRRFALSETLDSVGNGTELLVSNRTWSDPASEFSVLGSTEVWEFIGLTPSIDHPIHVHLVKFLITSVQPLNITSYNAGTCSILLEYGQPSSCFLNVSRGPSPQEIGWKDLASARAESVTRIAIRFTAQDGNSFRFDPTVGPGYVWHCHLLSHEDNAMMRPLYMVNSTTADAAATNGTNSMDSACTPVPSP